MTDPTVEKLRTLKRIGRFVARNWKYVGIGALVLIGLGLAGTQTLFGWPL